MIITSSIAMVIVALLIGLIVLTKIPKTKMKTSKYYLLGISFVGIFIGVSRGIFLYHDYFAPDSLDLLLWKLANITTFIALTSLAFTIERFIFQKTKMVITIIGIASIILMIFVEKPIASVLVTVTTATLVLLPFIIYIYMAKISTGAVRNRALIIILGILLIFIGQVGGSVLFNLNVLDRTASQIFGVGGSLIGLILISYGLIRSIESIT
ncbi:MAG: hypothetical protein ACFFCS_26010 [Candidatus Hodarchaeota archaeon]